MKQAPSQVSSEKDSLGQTLKGLLSEISAIIEGCVVNKSLARTSYPNITLLKSKCYDYERRTRMVMLPWLLLTELLRFAYQDSYLHCLFELVVSYVICLLAFARLKEDRLAFDLSDYCALPGSERLLTPTERDAYALSQRFSQVQRPRFCQTPADFIDAAISSVCNQAHDCFSTTGLSILYFVNEKLDKDVFVFYPSGWARSAEQHAFCVVNLICHDKDRANFNNWNDDAYLFDPWYGICMSVVSIKADPYFFTNYPLLCVDGKDYAGQGMVLSCSFNPSRPSSALVAAVERYDELQNALIQEGVCRI